MSIPWRDRIATLLVATATIIYLLWLTGPIEGLAASSVAVVVLALGFIASASAVVPGFAGLLSGSKVVPGSRVARRARRAGVWRPDRHPGDRADARSARGCDDRALGGLHRPARGRSPSDRGRRGLTIWGVEAWPLVAPAAVLDSCFRTRAASRSRPTGGASASDRANHERAGQRWRRSRRVLPIGSPGSRPIFGRSGSGEDRARGR